MPWKVTDVDKHIKGLTANQKKQWVAVANSARAKCISDGGSTDQCDASAIKQANGVLAKAKETADMSKQVISAQTISEQLATVERGRVLNSANEGLLKQVAKLVSQVLSSLKSSASVDDDTEDEEADDKTTEAGTFNQTDTYTLLQAALAASGNDMYSTYIADVYEDQGYFVYRKGYSGGYYRTDFDISTDGTVTLGTPLSVVRKVTYITPSDTSNLPPPTATTNTAESSTDVETPITGDVVQLVERAVKPDGTVMLKLIAPGWGSSGYYSREVLQRDGPKIFRRGMHNFIDHPTATEEAEKPEGSIAKLGSTLVEDARWYDDYQGYGAGLYAPAKPSPTFAETLDVIAKDIGTSIRAFGKARKGTAPDGKTGNIIEALTGAKSVDYVTVAGAGGKVLTLIESARAQTNTGEDQMSAEALAALQAQVNTLTESNARLQEALHLQSAERIVATHLATKNLPAPTMQRLQGALATRYTLTEAGQLDRAALITAIDQAVNTELAYLREMGVGAQFSALGTLVGIAPDASLQEGAAPSDTFTEDMISVYRDLGMSESEAKRAAVGRA